MTEDAIAAEVGAARDGCHARRSLTPNVLVRTLINGVAASPLLQLWQAGQVQLVVSVETLAELAAVLTRSKFQRYFTADNVTALLTLLREHGEWVVINPTWRCAAIPKMTSSSTSRLPRKPLTSCQKTTISWQTPALTATMLTDYSNSDRARSRIGQGAGFLKSPS